MSFHLGRTVSKAMMTSETGKIRTGAFTVLEVLLVLFLIALLGTIFVVNIDNLLRDREEASVERAFWDASHKARMQALFLRKPVSLFFDEENSAFQMISEGNLLETFPARNTTATGDPITVHFVQQRASNELILIRGQLIDNQPIAQVSYYPDGSCTSFWLQLDFAGESRQIQVDPWTGAEMLSKAR